MSALPLPLCISVAEAARLIGVSRYTIYELVKSGEIASSRVGRRILVDREPFLEYAASLPSAAQAAS